MDVCLSCKWRVYACVFCSIPVLLYTNIQMYKNALVKIWEEEEARRGVWERKYNTVS